MSTYACSDLHGNYSLFKKIQEFLKPEDVCYNLGDNVDRGPDGLQIIQEMRKDKRFIPLLGNHEDLMLDACSEWEEGMSSTMQIWTAECNGGKPTFQKYKRMDTFKRIGILDYVRKWPLKLVYINPNGDNVILTHSGYSPNVDEENRQNFTWNRDHIKDVAWKGQPNEYIVHGHTPTMSAGYFNNNRVVAWQYCEGHKIAIDLAAYATETTALLDLDNFEVHYLTNLLDI